MKIRKNKNNLHNENISQNQRKRLKEIEEEISILKDNQELMISLQEKTLKSPALNVGFSQLMFKIEKIEQSQEELVKKTNLIHESVFNPDEGLYARVKNVENETSEEFLKIKSDISSLAKWKEKEEIETEKIKNSKTEQEKMILSQKITIDELVVFKQKLSSIGKWAMASFSGSVITLLFKLLYDFLITKI